MTQPLVDNNTFNEKVISRVPLKRWGNAAEFENVAVYLMSDGSGFHTGDEIVIDGGYSQF
jgi:NAD(P)-dependent dehydrogenase (short-subunit alcohol dehydrogenase family)